MNFLAHAFLAGDSPALIVGGVLGDWIKGYLPGDLPEDLAAGVALHRAIDSIAEINPAFCRSRARVSPERRRYAGVLVDIFYDHLLASRWQRHHPVPLTDFTAGVYQTIAQHRAVIPEHAHGALRLMAQEDWLASYAHLDGMADVLERMGRRTRRPSPLAGAEVEFLAAPEQFADDFDAWLVDAQQFVRSYHQVT